MWVEFFHVPLCSKGSYVFLYYYKVTKIQKVHIPFGCVILTRSDILNGGYGGSRCSLRLRGTFHNDAYDFENDHVLERNYIAAKDGSLDAKKIQKTCILACNKLKNEVGNIPTLLKSLYAFPKDVLDVLDK